MKRTRSEIQSEIKDLSGKLEAARWELQDHPDQLKEKVPKALHPLFLDSKRLTRFYCSRFDNVDETYHGAGTVKTTKDEWNCTIVLDGDTHKFQAERWGNDDFEFDRFPATLRHRLPWKKVLKRNDNDEAGALASLALRFEQIGESLGTFDDKHDSDSDASDNGEVDDTKEIIVMSGGKYYKLSK
jgi:hypothetical protein